MESTIRLASADDAEDAQALYEWHVRDSTVSFELTPPSAETVKRRIVDIIESHPWLVCEPDGEVVEYATLDRISHGKRTNGPSKVRYM